MDQTTEKLKKYARDILEMSTEEVGLVKIGGNAFLDKESRETIWTFEFDGIGTLYDGAMPMNRHVVVSAAAGDFEPLKSWLIEQVGLIVAGFIVQGQDLPDSVELVIGEWINVQPIKGNDKAVASLNRMADGLRKEFEMWMKMSAGIGSHIPVAEA
jgi:hypothetical protein